MSVHTYIGARYVPRFVGTYDVTQIYDALDVVDNGSGTSYIARKTVPAGTPLTDTDYWFVYGASSGAIIQLQNDMIQAQNDIGDLQTDVGALQPVVERLSERAFIMISDSYGNRTNASSETFFDIFGTALGLDSDHLYHAATGSASFYNTTPSLKFLTTLQGITVTDPNKITDVVVIGGSNDAAQTEANTRSAIAEFKNYVRSTYPNAKITLFPCGLTFTTSGMPYVMKRMLPAWQGCCDIKVGYVPNAEYLLKNTKLLESDYCHPNGDGVNLIGNALINWAYGNGVNAEHYIDLENNFTAEQTTGTALTVTSTTNHLNMRRRNGSVSTGFGNAKSVSVKRADNNAFNIGGGAGIKFILGDVLDVGRSDCYPVYTAFVYSSVLNKIYPSIAYLDVSTTEAALIVTIPGGVPSSDNVTTLNILVAIPSTD